MCNPVSGLINADHTIYLPDPATWEHSHTRLAEKAGIPNGLIGDKWVRFELTPKDSDFRSDISTWRLHLDEERKVDWWAEDLPAIDDKIRRAVKRYMDGAWTAGAAPQSVIASTGDRAASSSTGDRAASSSTGYMAASSSTGNKAASSSTGNKAASSSTGNMAASSSTGDMAASSSTGYMAASSSTGYMAASSSTGNKAASSSTGHMAASSSTGNKAASSSTGDRAASSATGIESAAVSVGYRSAVRGAKGCALLAAERDDDMKLIGWVFGVVGEKGINANVWYEAKNGKFVACDAARVTDIEDVIAKAGAEAVKPEQCGPQAK